MFFLLHICFFQTDMLRHLLPLLLVGLATADDVLELVDSDFDSKLADIETALVMFYAPWWVKNLNFIIII